MPGTKKKPPFRADHVGSLLRTPELLAARARKLKGEITAEQLRTVEDAAIRKAVALQESVGLQAVTDGEYRRTFFHVDFLERLEGVSVQGGMPIKFHSRDSEVEFSPPKLTVSGKLRHVKPIQVDDFNFLKSVTKKTPKVTIPSPTMLHFRGGRKGVDEKAYPTMEAFFKDLAGVYQQEIDLLAKAGCRYLQMDDTNLAYLCDPAMRERAKQIGEDPAALPSLYARIINEAIKKRPSDMTIAVHLCRGNFQSAWVAEGGYEPVAEVLFNELNVDAYFLEYDDERSGDFKPLRFVPKGKTVVLGIVSSKIAQLEAKDGLKRRIEEASKFVDMDHLAISPQCGFSSTVEGNRVTEADEIAKLRLVVEMANEVWG
ncbi:MAG: 5-methyltetrahydropteroyltriglutamate--homocysteine S-methyltransferase [Deltaproteobacteria bacterium]|nr:5-methyltetrahydropteroyltriglutamate--homocysteine S-methyltransferase [Deltaproteobacteria bacterium]